MNSTIQALRAVTAVYIRRILKLMLWIVGGLLLVLYLLVAYLSVDLSAWWLLALIVIIPLTVIAAIAIYLLWFGVKLLMPRRLTKQEMSQLLQFADKMTTVIEGARTPYPIALILIAKDVVRKRESSFLKRLINDSGSLKGDFETIKKLF